MKITDIKVKWFAGTGRIPYFVVSVDDIPTELEYQRKRRFFYARAGGFVRFYYVSKDKGGLSGSGVPILFHERELILKGPWMSRPSVFNTLGLFQCGEAEIYMEGKYIQGYLSLDRLIECATRCGIYLVKYYMDGGLKFTKLFGDTPPGAEFSFCPSVSNEKLEKPDVYPFCN